MIDSMSIRTDVRWDASRKCMRGYVNHGHSVADVDFDTSEVATEALVILAVGILGHWKAPVGYFFTNKLTGSVQCQLINQVITEMHYIGFDVVALVMDGLAANKSMALELGCNLNVNNLSPCFTNPVDASKSVAIFFDACHMLKLLRNLFHSFQSLYIPDIGVVKFEHVKVLHQAQEREGLRAANKLTTCHVEFERQIMKVKLAAQLFSSSVSKGIKLARNLNIPGFENSEGTENFVAIINR